MDSIVRTSSRLPSLNGLRAFEAAARHLSFTRAASELNVTQTAISHQIKRLEDELGLRLFVRQNRSLALTPQAREYLPLVRAAFDDLRLATERLVRRDGGKVLTVSTIASHAAKWLLPRLSAFQEAHPEIDVRITTSSSLVDFAKEDVDAAIRYGRGHWPGVRAEWLMGDELFPVCSPALLKGSKPLRSPEDLAQHTLLHSSYDDDWRLWLTAAGLPVSISKHRGVSFDLIFMTIQAAIDGLGVAIGRTSYVQDDISKGRLVVPFQIALPVDAGYYLVSPEGRTDAPKLRAFRAWLKAAAQNKS
ncbi:putative Transcriptional Regulator, LysR family; Glycine cleavage system transcriptional activator (Gcv operon activator) [Bradyrhizobium sp. STM 3843]|uniref:transcriptional regulator GcvA n=1 Tax=Bradyrhizobium sp. STM 3843 TaxID=551947 RepID=UPI00024046DC|nr:transcriptional regulator GcvA [Bradyrhizobium sp. STM 3843]CCE11020.1 putative Transcriptional Regulator, LysR family; Glycine cleavage system transcriptional activator (Gcv operon activator) [Bradyrhizobium sp. STM 3843]